VSDLTLGEKLRPGDQAPLPPDCGAARIHTPLGQKVGLLINPLGMCRTARIKWAGRQSGEVRIRWKEPISGRSRSRLCDPVAVSIAVKRWA
jgi:hypothetical protein